MTSSPHAAAPGGARHFVSIVGIGEDGVEALSPGARAAIGAAELVWGGPRHLALADALIRGERRRWASPIAASVEAIASLRGSGARVAVLASGDPFCFGVGPLLAARLAPGEWDSRPQPSCLSLAAGALGWALQEVAAVSLCGRPLATLDAALAPEARLLVLSADATTPAAIAARLVARGAGGAVLHVMERLGGPRARIRRIAVGAAIPADIADPNLVAIDLRGAGLAGGAGRTAPLAPGLPSDRFEHDGQITGATPRAAALAALAPLPGQLLWDVGAGAGAVAIEWARCDPSLRAVAFERDAGRGDRLLRNAAALGVAGRVSLVRGEAPVSFAREGADPDAVFVGGGGRAATIAASWDRLAPGGALVAHAVTVETELALLDAQSRLGGALARIAIERLDRIGRYRAFRPAMTVTQYAVRKPS